MPRPEIQLDGVVPIIPTPFTKDEAIDLPALAACVRFAFERGMTACCLPAHASDFYKLSDVERGLVVEAAVKEAGGRIAIVAQANHPAARVAAETARRY